MTITPLEIRNEYTATAGQTVFSYTFKIFSATDLNVYVTPVGQDANDSADLTTAYVVDAGTIGDSAGGFLTLDVGANLNELVTIVSNVPSSRTTDYQNNGDFLPDTVNEDFDRVVSLAKQADSVASRLVRFPESQQGIASITLPPPSPGEFLSWNAGGDGFDNAGASEISGSILTDPTGNKAINGNPYLIEDVITFVGGGNSAWNLTDHPEATLELTASTTTLTTTVVPPAGTYGTVRVVQGGAGSFTLAYSADFDFGDAGEPTLSTVAGEEDLISFRSNGTKLHFVGAATGFA